MSQAAAADADLRPHIARAMAAAAAADAAAFGPAVAALCRAAAAAAAADGGRPSTMVVGVLSCAGGVGGGWAGLADDTGSVPVALATAAGGGGSSSGGGSGGPGRLDDVCAVRRFSAVLSAPHDLGGGRGGEPAGAGRRRRRRCRRRRRRASPGVTHGGVGTGDRPAGSWCGERWWWWWWRRRREGTAARRSRSPPRASAALGGCAAEAAGCGQGAAGRILWGGCALCGGSLSRGPARLAHPDPSQSTRGGPDAPHHPSRHWAGAGPTRDASLCGRIGPARPGPARPGSS